VETENFSHQRPEQARRARRRQAAIRRRRRLAALACVILVVVVALVVWLALRSDNSAASANAGGIDSAASASADSSSGTSTSTTPTTAPNLAPQKLTISADPKATDLAITLQDGTALSGVTPYSEQVPGGNITLTLSKDGYKAATRQIDLTKETSVSVWLDPEGLLFDSLVRFTCGPNPKQVVFTPDGKELWVSLLGGAGLEVFDPLTGEKLSQITLGEHGAVEVIFTKDGKTAYASQMETASVYEIDRVSRKVTRQFKTGGSWTKVLLLSPDEKTLWASNWVSDDVSEIDLTTGKLVRRMKTVDTPRGLYCTPDGARLYVAGYENGDIERIDLDTGKGTVIFKTGGAMRHMVGDDKRGLLYVDDMATIGKVVYVVDLATDRVTKLATTDERPNTMDLSPDGKVLYVSNRGKDNPKSYYITGPEWGSVLAIDTATGTILDAIVGGNQCTGLDVSPDGTLLAFSDFLDNRIRIYMIPEYEVLANGNGGRAVAHLEDIVK
jgi:DNA-binding beta-propeller fold protein YncE